MAETEFTVQTDFEQIQAFCQFAEKYKTDFSTPELKAFQEMPLNQVHKYICDKYTLEEGEQIIRPLIYHKLGKQAGDCDDGFIFVCALLRSVGVDPEKIIVCEAKESDFDDDYCHIFAAVEIGSKIIWLDNLPHTRYNTLHYPKRRVRLSRFSEYL